MNKKSNKKYSTQNNYLKSKLKELKKQQQQKQTIYIYINYI